jgi:hypothetical protein
MTTMSELPPLLPKGPSIILTIRVEIDPHNLDTALFAWCEELAEMARQQGEVTSLTLDNFPTRLVLEGRAL